MSNPNEIQVSGFVKSTVDRAISASRQSGEHSTLKPVTDAEYDDICSYLWEISSTGLGATGGLPYFQFIGDGWEVRVTVP